MPQNEPQRLTVIVIVQTLAHVTLLDTLPSSGENRIIRKCEVRVHLVNCTCIEKGVQLKSKTQRDWKQHHRHSVLSPNSILSPPACHYAVVSPGNFRRGFKMLLF